MTPPLLVIDPLDVQPLGAKAQIAALLASPPSF
jgi:hypothetical protein